MTLILVAAALYLLGAYVALRLSFAMLTLVENRAVRRGTKTFLFSLFLAPGYQSMGVGVVPVPALINVITGWAHRKHGHFDMYTWFDFWTQGLSHILVCWAVLFLFSLLYRSKSEAAKEGM
jgi:GNAT superfamily N-acetyltransferase